MPGGRSDGAEAGTLRVEVGSDGHVRLIGELDILHAGCLGSYLAGASGATVTIDLRELSFIDVRGATALAAAKREIAARGGELVVEHASPMVRRVFEVLGWHTLVGG